MSSFVGTAVYDLSIFLTGAVLGNGYPCNPIVLCVWYPSGTDFLTLMPTLRSDACVSSGRGGDIGERARSGAELEGASRLWKKEWIDGWYCRLRTWLSEAVVAAIFATFMAVRCIRACRRASLDLPAQPRSAQEAVV